MPELNEVELPAVEGFDVLRLLGEGGMGRVYEAKELGATARRVALKVIRSELSGGEGRRRFEQEQRAIARLDHESVARAHFGGETQSGEPYLAMQLVNGSSISDYCDQRRLSIRERGQLFVRVLDGVHHAHTRGVVHRDLKPSNVLVEDSSDGGRPRIVDFGVALLQGPLDEATRLTQTGLVPGTPAYLAPELVTGDAPHATKVTDVYSLGVMLFELVVGALPFERAQYNYPAVLSLAATQPLTLSARLTTLPDREMKALLRATTFKALERECRGPLSVIVGRAIQPDPAARYRSVEDLRQDLNRYLDGEVGRFVMGGALSAVVFPFRAMGQWQQKLQRYAVISWSGSSIALLGLLSIGLSELAISDPLLLRGFAVVIVVAQFSLFTMALRVDQRRQRPFYLPAVVLGILSLVGMVTLAYELWVGR